MQIDIRSVSSVYSGRPGCCCGCRGKHRYASAHRNAASKARGYRVTDDEVSDRSVATIVRKIEAMGDRAKLHGDFVSVETETRLLIAYFRGRA